MDLLAAEITARTGKDPGEHFQALAAEFGTPYYTRIDAPATPEQKARLEKLSPEAVKESELAGEPITAKLTRAPGNNEPIGGLKVVTANGWFAARPSGTENLYKVYAESFRDEKHLEAIVDEAQKHRESRPGWRRKAARCLTWQPQHQRETNMAAAVTPLTRRNAWKALSTHYQTARKWHLRRPLRRRPQTRRAHDGRSRRPFPRLLQEPRHRQDPEAARATGGGIRPARAH